jgi:hypothetical protein
MGGGVEQGNMARDYSVLTLQAIVTLYKSLGGGWK